MTAASWVTAVANAGRKFMKWETFLTRREGDRVEQRVASRDRVVITLACSRWGLWGDAKAPHTVLGEIAAVRSCYLIAAQRRARAAHKAWAHVVSTAGATVQGTTAARVMASLLTGVDTTQALFRSTR